MITDTTRAVAEMIDGFNKMAGCPPEACVSVAEHAVRKAKLPPETVQEALRYLNSQDRF